MSQTSRSPFGFLWSLFVALLGRMRLVTMGTYEVLQGRVTELETAMTALRTQQATLTAQRLEHQGKHNEFALRAILQLRDELRALPLLNGAVVQPIQIDRQVMSFVIGPMRVVVNPFERWMRLAPAVMTTPEIGSKLLNFDDDGCLSEDQITLALGYVTRLQQEVPASPFWHVGSAVA